MPDPSMSGASRIPPLDAARKEADWLELSVAADGEAAEAVIELFNRYGHGGAVMETLFDSGSAWEHELSGAPPPSVVTIKAYLPSNEEGRTLRRRLEEGLWHLGRIYPVPEPVVRELMEEDWANAWKQQYQPLPIGRKTLIVPAWHADNPISDRIVIRLEPGMAFGTGLHPTTRLCLMALEDALVPTRNAAAQHERRSASSVLDVGTGTGVLAIAAAKLGAQVVFALDTDPVAASVARENVQNNGVSEQVTVLHGTLPVGKGIPGVERQPAWSGTSPASLDQGAFDLVVINILAHVIIDMMPALSARISPGGRLVAAGLVEGQEHEVVRAMLEEELHVIGRAQEKDWVVLVAERGLERRLPLA